MSSSQKITWIADVTVLRRYLRTYLFPLFFSVAVFPRTFYEDGICIDFRSNISEYSWSSVIMFAKLSLNGCMRAVSHSKKYMFGSQLSSTSLTKSVCLGFRCVKFHETCFALALYSLILRNKFLPYNDINRRKHVSCLCLIACRFAHIFIL